MYSDLNLQCNNLNKVNFFNNIFELKINNLNYNQNDNYNKHIYLYYNQYIVDVCSLQHYMYYF